MFPALLTLLAMVSPDSVLVIRGATLIDGTGGRPVPNAVVVVRGGRLAAVGRAGRVRIPRGARIMEAPGKFLLPGFIDAHAHVAFGPVTLEPGKGPVVHFDETASRELAGVLLDFGITSARSPGGPAEQAVALRNAIAAGALRGPRLVVAGDILDPVPSGMSVLVRNEAEVRAEVARQATLGVDFIKVYTGMSPPLLAAAVDEAHRRRVRVIGHLMMTNWGQAAHLGIDGIVHITPLSPTLIEPGRRAEFFKSITSTRFMLDWFTAADLEGPLMTAALDSLRVHHIVVDPTLVIFEAMARGDDPAITASPDLALAPAAYRENWRQVQLTTGWKPEDFAAARAAWPRVEALVRRMRDRGVTLAVGSDTPNPWVVPGASFHREMELLVAAGLPPQEVIVAATRNSALAAGLEAEAGTVAVGKRADLVLLDADPLAAITNTRRIRWVMQAGRIVVPDEAAADTTGFPAVRALIDRLSEAVRAANGEQMLSVYVQEEPISFSAHGIAITSRAAIAAQYRAWNPERMRGGFMAWQRLRLLPVGPAAILAEGTFRIAQGTPTGAPADTLLGTWSGLFEKRRGRWGLAHEHESFATVRPR